MSIQDLGNIGEFIAALGLLISLVFVLIELRHARKAARIAGAENRIASWVEWRRQFLNDPYLRKVFRKGCNDPNDLDPDEFHAFDILMNERMTIILRMFIRGTELNDREEYAQARGNLVDQFQNWPGAEKWWSQQRMGYREYFRNFVDESLRISKDSA